MRLDCGILERLATEWTPVAVLHPGHGPVEEPGAGPEARDLDYSCEDLIRSEVEPDPIILPSDVDAGRFRFCIDGATADSLQATRSPWTTQCVEFDVLDES